MNPAITLAESEVEITAIRAQGRAANVNKVSNAVHLRFDIPASSLPEAVKARLLARRDQRISADGWSSSRRSSIAAWNATGTTPSPACGNSSPPRPARPRPGGRPNRAAAPSGSDWKTKVKRGQVKLLRPDQRSSKDSLPIGRPQAFNQPAADVGDLFDTDGMGHGVAVPVRS